MKTDKQTDRTDTDICVNKQTFSRMNTARHQEITVQKTIFVMMEKMSEQDRPSWTKCPELILAKLNPWLGCSFDFHFSPSLLIYLPDFLFLTHCMLVNFSCLCCHTDFFQNKLFQNILSGILSMCQTVWTQVCHS